VLDLQVTLNELPPTPLSLTLICALPRPKSFFKCIEVATVLGVKTMYFINSYRVEKNYWGSQKLAEDELQQHMILGLEQARDTILPKIEFKRRFKPFVEDELSGIIHTSRAMVAHPYAQQQCPYNYSGAVTLIIGPEGGFIPYEIEMLEKQGAEAVSFGSRILRVEHAVAALIGRIT
jgi:RsmE family RNA methyltransferase